MTMLWATRASLGSPVVTNGACIPGKMIAREPSTRMRDRRYLFLNSRELKRIRHLTFCTLALSFLDDDTGAFIIQLLYEIYNI